MNRLAICVICFVLIFGVCASTAAETDYPNKPIVMMIGYAPGGGSDLMARLVAEKARKYLGQEIIIVNKPGASGNVAMTLLSKAKPDGYTLCGATDTSVIFTPLTEKVSYKPMEDFTFISEYGTLDTALVVPADSPFHSLKDFIEFARKNPDKLTVSTIGKGGRSHVVLEALADIEGLKIRLIPFRGASPAMTALLGGHVMATSSAGSGFAPFVESGKVRLLTFFSPERVEGYPEVPTIAELGYHLDVQGHYLFSGPKNMDIAIVQKIENAFRNAMETPEFKKLGKNLCVDTSRILSGDELRKALIQRNANNRELLKRAGVKIRE